MKIIVFFIIVVISSCYADAQLVPKMECQRKMGRSQAEDIGAQLAQLLKLHVQMKDSGDQCAMRCFREKIFSIMDVMATVTGCPCQVIARLMVTRLPAPWKEDAAKIEDALMTEWNRDTNVLPDLQPTSDKAERRPAKGVRHTESNMNMRERRDGTALNSMSFNEDAIFSILMKAADAVLVAQDHNPNEMVEKGVLSLAATSTAQEINKIKKFLSELPVFSLQLDILMIDDAVPILKSGNSAVEIGGALKPVDNMDDLLGKLGVGKLPKVTGGGAGGH